MQDASEAGTDLTTEEMSALLQESKAIDFILPLMLDALECRDSDGRIYDEHPCRMLQKQTQRTALQQLLQLKERGIPIRESKHTVILYLEDASNKVQLMTGLWWIRMHFFFFFFCIAKQKKGSKWANHIELCGKSDFT